MSKKYCYESDDFKLIHGDSFKELKKIEENYETFVKTQDLSGMMEAYQEVLVNQDQQVRVLEPGHEYTGIARGINAMGELLVEREDGTITEVYAGEVSVRGLYGYV